VVGKAAPGVEAPADGFPQKPDVLDVAFFGDPQGGEFDAVAESPGMPMPPCLLKQQEPGEVPVFMARIRSSAAAPPASPTS
jgi:hypothetical protein